MARHKNYTNDQIKIVPVSFERQIVSDSFEYFLSYLIGHKLDLSTFRQPLVQR
jgi:hypothetical protein